MAATASTKVFGIGELLELILLDDQINFRQLFGWQRVNKLFHITIVSSTALKRKMHLLYPITMPDSLPRENTFEPLTRLRNDGRLLHKPFQYLGIETKNNYVKVRGMSQEDVTDTPPTLLLKTKIRETFHVEGQRPDYVKKIGCGSKKLGTHDRSCSWAKILMTSYPVVCRIKVRVLISGTGARPCESRYTEFVELSESSHTTLGELYEFLEAIVRRTKEEHIRRRGSLEDDGAQEEMYGSFGEALAAAKEMSD